MLFKSTSALAVLAIASQAIAEPMPYKPVKLTMSVREMFGIVGRDDTGYTPTQQYCGMGATCAEACGAGFDQCASNDKSIHCYNSAAAQTCCPDGTGNSCDAGFYCTADTVGETFCCPDGMGLADCAAKYGVTGSLSSEIPTPTSTSTSSTSSSSTSSSASSTSTSTFYEANNTTTTTVGSTGYVTTCTSTLSAEATFPSANSTSAVVPVTATSTPSTVPLSGASVAGPAGTLALLVAFAAAAML